jgi:hypothetical protein
MFCFTDIMGPAPTWTQRFQEQSIAGAPHPGRLCSELKLACSPSPASGSLEAGGNQSASSGISGQRRRRRAPRLHYRPVSDWLEAEIHPENWRIEIDLYCWYGALTFFRSRIDSRASSCVSNPSSLLEQVRLLPSADGAR